MALAERIETVEIGLKLSLKEAEYLKGLLQNPEAGHDNMTPDTRKEVEVRDNLRKDIFTALHTATLGRRG